MEWSVINVKCLKPYVLKSNMLPVPCGKCLGCRINRSKGWTFRLLAEATNYEPTNITFLTLTYDDEHLPSGLVKEDVQKFMKRLRKLYYPRLIRYFFCGEYGSETHRPHYHAILYGITPFELQLTISALWKFGFSTCLPANLEAMKYVAGYVTKKITYEEKNKDLPKEFILTSRRPGIGFGVVEHIIKHAKLQGDCPPYLNFGGSKYAVPHYIREKVRQALFADNLDALADYKQKIVDELRLDFILNWRYDEGLKNYYDYREREMKIKNKGTLHE